MRSLLSLARMLASLILSGLLLNAFVAPSEPEDELKSAIVLSFLRYSEFPASTGSDRALTVCILGRPNLAEIARRVLNGKVVNDRPVRVFEIKTAADPHNCQLLYVASDKSAEIKQALSDAHSMHVLTMGESDRFLDYGGAVNLLLVDGRMSFEVNLQALAGSGIEISSKLLRYGQVRGKP
jgi:hypothetical protein